MAGGIVYLDVDDEITSAAARIRDVPRRRVALVLPYGSRVATSRINFRLLSRDAMLNEKQLAVVAGDSATRALAASAGLPVFASVSEYESTQPDGGDGAGEPGAAARTASRRGRRRPRRARGRPAPLVAAPRPRRRNGHDAARRPAPAEATAPTEPVRPRTTAASRRPTRPADAVRPAGDHGRRRDRPVETPGPEAAAGRGRRVVRPAPRSCRVTAQRRGPGRSRLSAAARHRPGGARSGRARRRGRSVRRPAVRHDRGHAQGRGPRPACRSPSTADPDGHRARRRGRRRAAELIASRSR